MGRYLADFENIMRDGGVDKGEWVERVTPRLTEFLREKISRVEVVEDSYEEVKTVLLNAVGENSISYGYQLFEINSDTLKALSGEAMVALVQKVCRGMVQGAKTLEDGIFMWVLAVFRKWLPDGVNDGRVIERVVAVDERPMEQTGCLLSINLRNKEELRGIEKALERYSVCALTRSMARAEVLEKCESDEVVKGTKWCQEGIE